MKVRILGAHNLELQQARHTCFLVDDLIAIDAGSLMTTLSLEELKKIQVRWSPNFGQVLKIGSCS